MADQGQFGQQNDEQFFLVALVAVPVVMILMWHFFGRYVYAWERVALYGALSAWGSFPTDWPVLGWFTRQFLFFRYTPAKEIEFAGNVVPDSLVVNGVILMVMVVVLIRRVLFITTFHPFIIFGRSMNLYDYVEQQMPLYPHLRVMWRLRLLGRPLHEGLFRMGDSAKEFAIRNDLVRLPTLGGDPVLDEKKSKRVFERHLGMMLPMPTDDPVADARRCIARLDNNEKALLAAIVPRLAVCDPKVPDADFRVALEQSTKLVTQFWLGFDAYVPALPSEGAHNLNPDMPLVPPPPAVDTRGCDEILHKYLAYPRVRECMLSHAYVRTFLYDALQACRRVGKFSPTRFRWLRMKDRQLWLLVSSAGRNTPFWEVAGSHGHYLWERKAKQPTEKPHVEEAVTALRDELDGMLFTVDQKERVWASQGAVGVVLVPKGRKSLATGSTGATAAKVARR